MAPSTSFLGCHGSVSQLRPRQLNTLQGLATKHIADESLTDLASSDDFAVTSTERGLKHWEQAHLVAALDVLNAYQVNRKARLGVQVGGRSFFAGAQRQYSHDARTRAVEMLKRWLRTHAGEKCVNEDDVRGICGFCRDVLNHPALFPARNPRSFLRTIAEVYEHVQWQLREVLEKDRTCAELAHRVLSLSRNFVSDVLAYLLMAPTDLRQTDSLPSLEVVALWQSLPEEGHPLANRADPALQKAMKEAWRTQCGALVAATLRAPWCLSLFRASTCDNAAKDLEALPAGNECNRAGSADSELIATVKQQFEAGDLKNSGLAGAFRTQAQSGARQRYIEIAEDTFDLVYLLGEVLVHFHRVSDSLGDYGMIRAAPWLHPILESIVEKVQKIKSNLENLNEVVEGLYVLARARGTRIEKPAPTGQMSSRAHAAIDRAVVGKGNHASCLVQAVEELRLKSSPERLPHVMEGLGDACTSLQMVLSSAEFRARVGAGFPDLPPLGKTSMEGSQPLGNALKAEGGRAAVEYASIASVSTVLQVEDGREEGRDGSDSEPEVASNNTETWTAAVRNPSTRTPPAELQADVHRMVNAPYGQGLRRHDQRSLAIRNGKLLIFDKMSGTRVKTVVCLPHGVEVCNLRPGGLLSLVVHRVPPGAGPQDGVSECKQYTFKFEDEDMAAAFHRELTPARPPRRR